jgi:HEAT repeat protein
MGQLASVTATPKLAQHLNDPVESVRAAASEALADIGGDDALNHLWAALEAAGFDRLGYLAAALARFRPATSERLVRATGDASPDVRFWAARALGATGDERAIDVLLRLADEDHATTRTGSQVSTAAKQAMKTLKRMRSRTVR